MSDHGYAPGAIDFSSETSHHEPLKPAALMPLFGILLAMTAAAVLVGFMVTGPYKVWISLTLSVVQASTLAWFYMDLKNGDRVTWLCVGAAIFWTAILFTITLTDYFTRHHWAH